MVKDKYVGVIRAGVEDVLISGYQPRTMIEIDDDLTKKIIVPVSVDVRAGDHIEAYVDLEENIKTKRYRPPIIPWLKKVRRELKPTEYPFRVKFFDNGRIYKSTYDNGRYVEGEITSQSRSSQDLL